LISGIPGEAIGLAEEYSGNIYLLNTDVIMPEMNGRDLAARLQAVYPDLKCLFISGYTAILIAHHGVLDEEVQFFQKPFSRSDLATTVTPCWKRLKAQVMINYPILDRRLPHNISQLTEFRTE
jgi:YesN/AraC family two-component response regulator